MRGWLLAILAGVGSAAGAAQNASSMIQAAPGPARVPTATGIPGVIAAGTEAQLLRAGFNGTEGVISMPDGSVLFCEQEADKVVRIALNGNFSAYIEDANRPLGLAYDARGRLIATQSRDPKIGSLLPERTVLADSFEGEPLVRPNDLVVDSRGGIYFSDPLPDPRQQFREPPPGRKPLLFYITPTGTLTKLTDAIARPNGVQLSKNEKILYAVDGDRVMAFDVQPDGTVGKPRKFVDLTGDGLTVDSEDRLYVATKQGIHVVSAAGQVLGLIATAGRIQSVAFAGVDKRTLYAVGAGAAYRIPMLAQGIQGRAK